MCVMHVNMLNKVGCFSACSNLGNLKSCV